MFARTRIFLIHCIILHDVLYTHLIPPPLIPTSSSAARSKLPSVLPRVFALNPPASLQVHSNVVAACAKTTQSSCHPLKRNGLPAILGIIVSQSKKQNKENRKAGRLNATDQSVLSRGAEAGPLRARSCPKAYDACALTSARPPKADFRPNVLCFQKRSMREWSLATGSGLSSS